MADDEDIAALVVDNGSGMCKGECPRHRRREFSSIVSTIHFRVVR
jgi:hypothetical protein